MSFENGLLSDRPIPTCRDCGKIVHHRRARCKSCARKELFRGRKQRQPSESSESRPNLNERQLRYARRTEGLARLVRFTNAAGRYVSEITVLGQFGGCVRFSVPPYSRLSARVCSEQAEDFISWVPPRCSKRGRSSDVDLGKLSEQEELYLIAVMQEAAEAWQYFERQADAVGFRVDVRAGVFEHTVKLVTQAWEELHGKKLECSPGVGHCLEG